MNRRANDYHPSPRAAFLEDLDWLIVDLDPKLKWPTQRRRWHAAVQALLGRPDLGVDGRTVEARLEEELARVICTERAQSFAMRVRKSKRRSLEPRTQRK